MAKSVTLADIAAKVGVSSVAVYKALADKPGVSDKLRERIKQLADEMGYVSGAAEKAEAASKTGNIGIIIPEQYYGYSLSFYGQLHERVVKALYRSEYFGMLEIMTPEDEKEPPKVPGQLHGRPGIDLSRIKRISLPRCSLYHHDDHEHCCSRDPCTCQMSL